MLKHLNFFVLFCLFVCLVFVRGGGGGGEGAHASREKRSEDNSSDFEYF